MLKLIRRIKERAILRTYSSKDHRNVVGVTHMNGEPMFMLMIDVKEGVDLSQPIEAHNSAREIILYEFDSTEKIDNWIKVLNIIKQEMEEKR